MPTGRLRLSTRELTAVDLVERPDAGAGISNVATVLAELAPLDGARLAELAAARERSVARRLGWLPAFVEADADLEPHSSPRTSLPSSTTPTSPATWRRSSPRHRTATR